jgi:hypothetical protein
MRLRAFVLVLFVLLGTASEGFSFTPKAHGDDTALKALVALAQRDPHKKVKEEKNLAESEAPSPDSDKRAVPEKPKEPSPSFKDFVPSEKIDADKAVDFPADI